MTAAGLVIRNYLNSILPKNKITHLYIPGNKGQLKRESIWFQRGFLGVEGQNAIALQNFKPYAAKRENSLSQHSITKTDLFDDGFSGGNGSSERRKRLCKAAGLPTNISANALLEALNLLYDYDGYKDLIEKINLYN